MAQNLAVPDVAKWLDKKNDGAGDTWLPMIVKATNALVDSMPDKTMITNPDTGLEEWAETTWFGALMLAARLYNRRNSPNGVEALSEGGATYVARYDPDIARMLNLDSLQTPRVG